MKKNQELISWKYHWPSVREDVKTYAKSYDICLAAKAVRPKFYKNL